MSTVKSAMMIFIDDYACTARLATWNEEERKLESAADVSQVTISSQVLLSTKNDFAFSFPLCDESDDLDKTKVAFESEFEHYGLWEILDHLNDVDAAQPDYSIPAKYFGLLIRTCLELAAHTAWISDLFIAIPWLNNQQKNRLSAVLSLIRCVFELESITLFDSNRAAICGMKAPQECRKVVSVNVWRNGFSGNLWEKSNDQDTWSIRKQPGVTEEIPITFNNCDSFRPSCLAISLNLPDALLPAMKTGVCWKSLTGKLYHFEEKPGVISKNFFLEPIHVEQDALDRKLSDLNDSVLNNRVVFVGSLMFQPNIRRYVEDASKNLLTVQNHQPIPICEDHSPIQYVFEGMCELAKFGDGGIAIPESQWKLEEINGVEDPITEGKAIEFESVSPHSSDKQSNTDLSDVKIPLSFKGPGQQEGAFDLHIPLDAFDNDDKYLLEPSKTNDGSLRLLMRVGSRPVALKTGDANSTAKVTLGAGRGYELTFSDAHREEVRLQKQLKRFLDAGIHHYGSNLKSRNK